MSQRLVASLCCVAIATGALSACSNPRKSLGLEKHPPDEFAVVARAPLEMPPDFKLRPPEPGADRPQETRPTDVARSALMGGSAPTIGASSGNMAAPAAGGSAGNNSGFSSGYGGTSGASSGSNGFSSGFSSGGFSSGGSSSGFGSDYSAAPTASAPRAARPVLSGGQAALLKQAGADQAPADIRQQVNRETSTLAEEEKSFTDQVVFWRPAQPEGPVVNAPEEAKRLSNNQALGKSITTGDTPQIERRKRAILEGIF